MKKKISGIIAMIAFVAGTGVVTAGCSLGGSEGAKVEATEEAVKDTIGQSEVVEQSKKEETHIVDKKFSDEEAKQACKSLFEKALECVRNGDKEEFDSLFIADEKNEDWKKGVDEQYTYLQKYISDDYPNTDYYVIGGNGITFAVGILNTLVSGRYPDTKFLSYNLYYPLTNIDGEWRFDYTKKASDDINVCTEHLFPKEIWDAEKNGRNCTRFDSGDFSWTNPDLTIPGVLATNVYLAWQNADGSVGLLVNIKNGTDEIRNIRSIDVTLTDESLGEILNMKQGGDMLAPGTSKNYVITVDAGDIKTGTQKWTQIYNNVHTSNT